jgi:periplasmic divalent cation tolerance protein
VAWVIVDMQRAFAGPAVDGLAAQIAAAVRREPGPVWALVQVNPEDGPLRTLRSWAGCSNPQDAKVLDPVAQLNPTVVTKTGYGSRVELPLSTLAEFEKVFVAGVDTDACVLAMALGLFDAGVPVVVRADLCLSTGRSGVRLHETSLDILRRQLGSGRVVGSEAARQVQVLELRTRVADREVAAKIAATLVAEHLAACTHVRGPVESTYWWQDRLETAREWEVDAITTADMADRCSARIDELHPYQLPALLRTELTATADYAAWVHANTR